MMRRIPSLAFLLVILAFGTAETHRAQGVRTLKPVDEAPLDPEFLAFRTRLQAAVSNHDAVALMDVVHAEIKNGFGGDDGINAFKQMWRPEDPKSELWIQLGTVLGLGGSFDGPAGPARPASPSEFTAPYIFSKWPSGVDSFDFVAVTGAEVRLRAEPSSDAPVIGTVSYALLQLDTDFDSTRIVPDEWTTVKFNGKKGYIASRFVRSPIDYRARFSRLNGTWKLTFFLAGD
jgi:hypothetical protein